MEQANLEPVACLPGLYDLESGYQRTDTMLRYPQRPTAIFCCNEEIAIGALLSINEHRLRVPQDISLICYDSGQRAPFVRPALTSLHFPIIEMAQHAASLLIDPATPAVTYVPAVISRDSIAPPPLSEG